ncbi:T9SS type A sorting domain-containing protein [Adhaeribacter soli]|nr:T9SS type A sorting domain-containing protein [Adhaeribacter soli]
MLKKLQILMLAALFSGSITAQAQQVTITNGTDNSAMAPVDISKPYSANEMIYPQSRINQAGTITRIAFFKNAGASVAPIENVKIYLKLTPNTVFSAGTFDTTGYTRVFKGSFTNNAAAGWMEVALQTPFQYNNTGNLQLLFFRNGGHIDNSQRYAYGFVSGNASRRLSSLTPITSTTNLAPSDALANIRLDFTAVSGVGAEKQKHLLSVYPNPATTSLTLNGLRNATELTITDLAGRTVLSRALDKGLTMAELQIDNLPAGIYLIKVQQAAGLSVSRFIKE